MICTACGKVNGDGSAFCEHCGARMQGQPAGAVPAAAPAPYSAPPAAPAAPFMVAAPQAVQAGESLIASMSLGEKIAGAGAVAAVVGFFMPWISIAGAQTSYSGLDLAKSIGALTLVLADALVSAIICYLSSKATPSRKLWYAGYLTYLGALCGPANLVALIFVPKMQSAAGLGAWLCALGFTAVASGGLMTVRSFSKRVY